MEQGHGEGVQEQVPRGGQGEALVAGGEGWAERKLAPARAENAFVPPAALERPITQEFLASNRSVHNVEARWYGNEFFTLNICDQRAISLQLD